MKEAFLVAICVLASSIGPVLFINANFKMEFLLAGFVYSFICIAISNSVRFGESLFLNRLSERNKWLWGIGFGFIPFLSSILGHDISSLFEFHKTAGLFNFPVILGMTLLLIIYLVFRKENLKWATYKTGLNFMFVLFLIILLMPSIPNSEGKVFIGNVAIVYFFFRVLVFEL